MMFRFILALLVSFGLTADFAFAQAPSDSRLNTIAATKAVKIAYRTDATPFSFVAANQKEPTGYTIDLCKLIVRSLEKQLSVQGLAIEWVLVTSQSRFEAIASGKADMECASSTVTLGRMKQVDFSSMIFVETTGVVVKTAAGIKDAADLTGKKVAVITGTTNEQALTNLQRQGKLNVTLVSVPDRGQGVAALSNGTADAFASDKLLLAGAEFRDANTYTLLSVDLSYEPYGIALPRGDWALRLAVNTGLAQTYRNGQALEIFRKWFEPVGLRINGVMLAVYQFGALPD